MSDGSQDAVAASPPKPPAAWRYILAASIGLALLVAAGFALSAEYRRQDVVWVDVRDSYVRQDTINHMLGYLHGAESAQRGYIITGNPRELAKFEPVHRRIEGQFEELRRLYADLPDQQARLEALHHIVDSKYAEMEHVIALRHQQGLMAAADYVGTGRGRLLMDRARAVGERIAADDTQRLSDSIANSNENTQRVEKIVWVLISLIGAVFAAWLALSWFGRSSRHRIALEAHDTNKRLEAIFNGTIDGIILLNPSGSVETINASVTRLLGWEPEDVVRRDGGVLVDLLAQGPGNFLERMGFKDDKLANPIRVDRVGHHRDGYDVPVDVALGLLSLADGMHVVAALRDASDRRDAERMKDDFISTVSHELRTPLTSVVGALGLLRGGAAGQLSDQAGRLIDIAENNSRRLIRLINDILDLDKLAAGQMRITAVPLDLPSLLRHALQGAEGLATANEVKLHSEIAEEPILVRGDGERLLQVLSNLFSNAIRHSPVGKTVRLVLEHTDHHVLVSVEDEGSGIPAEFRDRIFKRFARAHGQAASGGTGLGLAISKDIIAAHEGDLWFEDIPGGGTAFRFSLPTWEEAPAREADGKPRILLCEENSKIAATLLTILEEADCVVNIMTTGREAQLAALGGSYDGVLIDIGFDGGNGLQLARALRQDIATDEIPIVILSAAGDEDAAEAHALEMIDWLEKPVDPSRLTKAVVTAIERSRAAKPVILHIDDDSDMLEVTAAALAGRGRMLRAVSLRSARRMLALDRPDIVILDLGLPDGSGAELLPELVTKDGVAIPTIIYSAQEVAPELSRQVDAVLVKSRRSLNSLEATIRTVLSRRGHRKS